MHRQNHTTVKQVQTRRHRRINTDTDTDTDTDVNRRTGGADFLSVGALPLDDFHWHIPLGVRVVLQTGRV